MIFNVKGRFNVCINQNQEEILPCKYFIHFVSDNEPYYVFRTMNCAQCVIMQNISILHRWVDDRDDISDSNAYHELLPGACAHKLLWAVYMHLAM